MEEIGRQVYDQECGDSILPMRIDGLLILPIRIEFLILSMRIGLLIFSMRIRLFNIVNENWAFDR